MVIYFVHKIMQEGDLHLVFKLIYMFNIKIIKRFFIIYNFKV